MGNRRVKARQPAPCGMKAAVEGSGVEAISIEGGVLAIHLLCDDDLGLSEP